MHFNNTHADVMIEKLMTVKLILRHWVTQLGAKFHLATACVLPPPVYS